MKRFLTGLLLTTAASSASAHTLASEEGLLTQLQHELMGAHHLPVTLLLLAGGFFVIRRLTRRSTR